MEKPIWLSLQAIYWESLSNYINGSSAEDHVNAGFSLADSSRIFALKQLIES
jgi:hypothetical protein